MTFSCRHHTIILENVWALRSFLSWVCRRGKEPCMEEIKVRETGSQREEDKHNQEFIMLPTGRRGFCSISAGFIPGS